MRYFDTVSEVSQVCFESDRSVLGPKFAVTVVPMYKPELNSVQTTNVSDKPRTAKYIVNVMNKDYGGKKLS